MKLNYVLQTFRTVSKITFYGMLVQTLFVQFLFASNVIGQKAENINNSYVQLEADSYTITNLFEAIEEATKFKFAYDAKDINQKVVIKLKENNYSVADVLYKVSDVAKLKFKQINNSIYVDKISSKKKNPTKIPVVLNEIAVSGKVVDEDGIGLPGATVIVKGSSIGTVTDADGYYRLSVDEAATLVFSFVGYIIIEEEVAGRTVIDVMLEPDSQVLQEVVVTGYQELSKERATGSFETLAGDVLLQRPTNDFVDKLDGMASGVNIVGGEVEIRGKSTIEGNAEPLYVVDGFPLSGSTLTVNPEDIESITVLKDAAAASIWGVRASNGVIVITTKKGSSAKGTRIDFSTFVAIDEAIDFDKMNWMATADEVDLDQEYIDKGWNNFPSEISARDPFTNVELANIYNQGYSPDGEIWTDETFNAYIANLKRKDNLRQWEDLMMQRAIRQSYNLSIASSGENNDIYASLVYNTNRGYAVGNSDDRVMLNISDQFSLKDRVFFSAGLNATIRSDETNGIKASEVKYENAYDELIDAYGRPVQYYQEFNPWVSQEREAIDGYFPYTFNYYEEMRNNDMSSQQVDLRSQFGVGVKIIEGLRFDTKFQYEKGFDNYDEFNSMNLPSHRIKVNNLYRPNEFDANGDEYGYQIPLGTEYIFQKNNYYAWDWRNTVSYDVSWEQHQISFFGGTEIRKHYREEVNDKVYGYDKQTTTYVPVNNADFLGGQIYTWDNSRFRERYGFFSLQNTDDREVSFFANAGYTFRDKYSVTGSFRIDQKNLFGSDPRFRYKPLWSAGASWQIAKEGFMSSVAFVNRLTLRATFGINGNASNKYSPYPQAKNYVRSWGANLYDYLTLTQPANDQLKWEETGVLNIATDFALFNNRLSGSLEYYVKNSTDLLGNRPLDPTNGFTRSIVNYASMRNEGVDVTLNGVLVETNDWLWSARLLFSYNSNRVTKIDDEVATTRRLIYDGSLKVGYPLDNMYSYNYAGLSDGGEVMVYTENGKVSWREGVENIDDLIYWGTTVAPYYGGLSTSVAYRGFDLSVNLSYKFGFRFNHNYGSGYGGLSARKDQIWTTRWKKPGDELVTRVPKIAYEGQNPYTGIYESHWDSTDGDHFWRYSQDMTLKGDFVKVRDIILGYTLSDKILGNAPVQSIRATVQVTNPFMWVANDRGIDPEYKYSMAWEGLAGITFGIRAAF